MFHYSYQLFGRVKNFTETIKSSEVLIDLVKDPAVQWKSLVIASNRNPKINLDFSRAEVESSDSETEPYFFIPYSDNPMYKDVSVYIVPNSLFFPQFRSDCCYHTKDAVA